MKNLKKQVTIFQGSFKEATKAFPKNINVSATIALALLLKKDVTVRIITSPTFKVNSHELVVEGDFGRITTKVESKPSKLNPKTSQLAVLSAVATLRDILANVRIGT